MKITKSGVTRVVVLIFLFLFLILYFMQLSGYNEYSQNRKNMLTEREIKEFEADVEAGKDVSMNDYLNQRKKDYRNIFRTQCWVFLQEYPIFLIKRWIAFSIC